MSRQKLMRVASVLLLLACAAHVGYAAALTTQASESTNAARPNVLLILTDDQRFDSLSITGNAWIETPNLDRIAREGCLFTRAYASTSRCAPARASLLTGKHAPAHNIWGNRSDIEFPGKHETFVERFDAAGYLTAWIGKWHLPGLGDGIVPGFDHFAGFDGPGKHYGQSFQIDGVERKTKGYLADESTEIALQFLDHPELQEGAPFLLCLSLKNPHVPLTPALRHAGVLDETEITLPASATDPASSLPVSYRAMRSEGSRHAAAAADKQRDDIRRYHEMILSVDDNVGRVLAKLQKRKQLQHTIVIFTSDNGQLLGEHGMTQKGVSYEPSIRVPLAVRYPAKIAAGTRLTSLVLNVDLAPSLLELCDLPALTHAQGASWVPLLSDPKADWRDRFLYMAPKVGTTSGPIERAVISKRWKYIIFRDGPRLEELLIDLKADPDERILIPRSRQNAALMNEMRAWMEGEYLRLSR
ncbi:MAG: arylsulfatase A-like enzyme [Planctomycetota bacterium]|jgi:arylsulfatase A-like enzyme